MSLSSFGIAIRKDRSMYGTVAHARVKSGKLEEVIALGEEWERERGPKVAGAVATYWFQSDNDPDQISIVAIFSDRETYHANAADPAQDAWYQKLKPLIDGDTTWTDGAVIMSGTYNVS